MKHILPLVFLLFGSAVVAQPHVQLSENSTVSLITCGPGTELYEAFGHTAIRVSDPASGFDIVYNYGTFDFNQPNFYWNFVQGRLLYFLSLSRYNNFVAAYQYYNRSVREQYLNLNLQQRQAVLDKLTWNAKNENREYMYDYFFDNCSTRPRDVINEALGGSIRFDSTFLGTERLSIRQLTDLYIRQEQPWGDLGIDLCLGARIDKPATAWEYMYLPEELERAFDHASIVSDSVDAPLVSRSTVVYEAQPMKEKDNWFVPQVVFVALLLFSSVLLTFQRVRGKSTRCFDGILFLFTSFFGFNAIFLWFFTTHYIAQNNWNLVWALPTHAIFGWALLKKNRPAWVRYYALFVIVVSTALLVGWNFIPQLLHYSLRFVVLLQMFVAVGVFRLSRTSVGSK